MNLLSDDDIVVAGAVLGVEPATLRAVRAVESRGRGFNPDGSVVTLFEGHVFCKYTSGKFSESHPDLSYTAWTKKFYGKTWQAEQQRLKRAMALDERAALLATSWGMFQIMGFNFAACNFASVMAFVEAMRESEKQQLIAFCQFVQSIGALDTLRSKNWAAFARRYNGPQYAKNRYDQKLARTYSQYT